MGPCKFPEFQPYASLHLSLHIPPNLTCDFRKPALAEVYGSDHSCTPFQPTRHPRIGGIARKSATSLADRLLRGPYRRTPGG